MQCPECGETFKPQYIIQRFCSKECRDIRHKGKFYITRGIPKVKNRNVHERVVAKIQNRPSVQKNNFDPSKDPEAKKQKPVTREFLQEKIQEFLKQGNCIKVLLPQSYGLKDFIADGALTRQHELGEPYSVEEDFVQLNDELVASGNYRDDDQVIHEKMIETRISLTLTHIPERRK